MWWPATKRTSARRKRVLPKVAIIAISLARVSREVAIATTRSVVLTVAKASLRDRMAFIKKALTPNLQLRGPDIGVTGPK